MFKKINNALKLSTLGLQALLLGSFLGFRPVYNWESVIYMLLEKATIEKK